MPLMGSAPTLMGFIGYSKCLCVNLLLLLLLFFLPLFFFFFFFLHLLLRRLLLQSVLRTHGLRVAAGCDYAQQQNLMSQAYNIPGWPGKVGYCDNSSGTTYLVSTFY